ncbi:DUF2917 domain-containing protein [Anaeromyxobacter diazotrophicus]|uniref:Uncharacterized protein n=1 Tax=Anaeromyxobacter diazotrophicus TaxID=2590199 RepID=A0A7I9VQP8_9BACT|nr:DUF2917 domain-containing protein [Anaeromyxobacter diazotrophicus]GEJ58681.1 hypothetical protein AMYX_34220 [Anaeromyxobacter diazotrophicus]
MSTHAEARELIGTGQRATRAEGSRGLQELPRDATVALRPGPRGLRLRCHRGTLMVTQEGDPLDHVLEQGEVVELGRRGLVAVWALSDAAMTAERA